MNRTFTFRFWDNNTLRFYYLHLDELIGLPPRIIEIQKGAIIQQYTGLKDKNGINIYEGDIVEYQHYYFDRVIKTVAKVEYSIDNGGFIAKSAHDSKHQDYVILICDVACESNVIGNIFESPELLNK